MNLKFGEKQTFICIYLVRKNGLVENYEIKGILTITNKWQEPVFQILQILLLMNVGAVILRYIHVLILIGSKVMTKMQPEIASTLG